MAKMLGRKDQAVYEAALSPDRTTLRQTARANRPAGVLVPMAQAKVQAAVSRQSTKPAATGPAVPLGTNRRTPGTGLNLAAVRAAAPFTPARRDVPDLAGSIRDTLKRTRRPAVVGRGASRGY